MCDAFQSGTLRYCGPTLFADGLWAGIELDEAVGKNNGTVDGILYFRCPPNYGMSVRQLSTVPSWLRPNITTVGDVH